MKKITVFLCMISFASYSQIHFLTNRDEKISYSEYDNLKYLASIDDSFFAFETIKRFYDNGTTLLYSVSDNSKDESFCKFTILPSGTIEYTTSRKIKGKAILNSGTLKINGVNYFLNISSCSDELCTYWVYVNKELVYKGDAKLIKK